MESASTAQMSLPPGSIGVNDNTVFFTPWTLQGGMVRAHSSGGLVQGTDRSDLLLDGPADDQILGLAGDDLYISFTGHDLVDFGAGLDVAMYFSPRRNFRISGSEKSLEVEDMQGQEGHDTFFNIERLSFADKNVALDMDGSAGWVARVIGTVWGQARLADAALVGKGLRLLDNGMSHSALAAAALDAAYGPVRDNETLLKTLYHNVHGVDPIADILGAYVGGIQSGALSQVDVCVLIAGSDHNADQIGLAGLRSTGLEYLM